MNARNSLMTMMILSSLLSACVDEAENQEIALLEESLSDDEALRPFHVAVFDHQPTEEEVEAEFLEFQGSIRDLAAENDPAGLLGAMGYIAPAVGQKLIRLDAVTSNISGAGANAPLEFTGRWLTNVGGQQYVETFSLDNPGVDDTERNTTSIFYYLVNLGNYVPGATQDKFLQGKIANWGTDGWHCSVMYVKDRNYLGYQRTQSLPFNQWVDSPTVTESPWMNGNNITWMSYY